VDEGGVEDGWAVRMDGWIAWEAEEGVAASALLYSFLLFLPFVQGSHTPSPARRGGGSLCIRERVRRGPSVSYVSFM